MAKENKYLQIEFGTGNLFAYSKEQKEGYEQHASSKGNISFREYHKEGVYGIYRGASVRETKFGKEISLHMVDVEGTNIYISFPLFDQSKNIAVYAEALITLLPALQMNFVYRVFPYAMDRKGTEFKNYGVSIKHANMQERSVREDYPLDRLTYTYEKDGKLVQGDIPAVKWVENFDKTMKKDQNEKNAFLYKVLEAHATGSEKMSNKTSGGPAPTAYDGTAGAQAPEQPKAQEVPTAKEEPQPQEEDGVVYQQDFNKEVPAGAPAPVATPQAEAPAGSGPAPVKLPF